MTQLRARWLRLPALGGLLGITGLLGLLHFARRGQPPHRPTGGELMGMTDAEFVSFVQASGVQTVTSAGLAPRDDPPD